MSVAVIAGGSGAIGSNFARHLLKRSNLGIVATARNPTSAKAKILEGIEDEEQKKRLTVLELDSTKEDSIAEAAKEVKSKYGEGSLKLLINATGILNADKSIQQVTMEDLLQSYQINTFGHILTLKHFTPLLPKEADLRKAKESGNYEDHANGTVPKDLSVVASLTARVGSIGDNKKGGWYGYRSSKAATNQVIQTLFREFTMKATPSIAVALHPGTVVNTNLSAKWTKEEDAGKKEGVFTAEESTRKLLDIIAGLKKEDSGRFLDWAKKDIQW